MDGFLMFASRMLAPFDAVDDCKCFTVPSQKATSKNFFRTSAYCTPRPIEHACRTEHGFGQRYEKVLSTAICNDFKYGNS